MKTEKKQYAEAEGLFTWPADEPHLIGSLRKGCSTYFFPKFSEFHRPSCPQGPVEEVLLSRTGQIGNLYCAALSCGIALCEAPAACSFLSGHSSVI